MKSQVDSKTIKELTKSFLAQLTLIGEKPKRQFLLGLIGMVGSGRTTVATQIVGSMPGVVSIQANSVRCLLRNRGLLWGENVGAILAIVANELLFRGYAVVVDGNTASEEERNNIADIGRSFNIRPDYLMIEINPQIAAARTRKKYDNPNWISSFFEFRVNTTERMVANVLDPKRVELFARLVPERITGLSQIIGNNGSKVDLEKQVRFFVEKFREL